MPNEIIAYLYGWKIDHETYEIWHFAYPKLLISEPQFVQACAYSLEECTNKASTLGYTRLSSIHSHPDGEVTPSQVDHDGMFDKTYSEVISGICAVYNGKTHVNFWHRKSPVPVTIEYL